MSNLVSASGVNPQSQVFLIIGGDKNNVICACVYHRKQLLKGQLSLGTNLLTVPPRSEPTKRDIGLALSGGGSRAIAFHLGCLRALNDKNLLNRVQVISTVSGGSVIGALYAYTEGNFDAFEEVVNNLLRKGFAKSILRKFLSPVSLINTFGCLLISGLSALLLFILRFMANRSRISGLKSWAKRDHPPFRRWYSRTTVFESILKKTVFGNADLTEVKRPGIDIVINACELRTGTAFRFGSRESGSWRFYKRLARSPKVFEAVAASAASPVFLPALDKKLEFVDRMGEIKKDRVILTDGGIFDNLGISAFDPGRSETFSTNVFHPEYIICCSAGAGQFSGESSPYWWGGRMNASFEAVFRKAIGHGYSQLYQWQSVGKIKGFVLPYLGQQDKSLPYEIAGLVPREKVKDYPTDFNAMSKDDIEILSRRGEQLTRALLAHYCPELC